MHVALVCEATMQRMHVALVCEATMQRMHVALVCEATMQCMHVALVCEATMQCMHVALVCEATMQRMHARGTCLWSGPRGIRHTDTCAPMHRRTHTPGYASSAPSVKCCRSSSISVPATPHSSINKHIHIHKHAAPKALPTWTPHPPGDWKLRSRTWCRWRWRWRGGPAQAATQQEWKNVVGSSKEPQHSFLWCTLPSFQWCTLPAFLSVMHTASVPFC